MTDRPPFTTEGELMHVQHNADSGDTKEELQAQVIELKSQVDANAEVNRQALYALEERLKLKDEFVVFREDVRKKFSFFKWSASAGAVILGIAGALGFKTITDYTNSIKGEMLAKLDHIDSYYYEFSRAVALSNAGEAKEALPHFRNCFDQEGGHYDEGLLVAYLQTLDYADDWEQTNDVIQAIKADHKKYEALKSPWLWGNLASLQIEMGIENSDSLAEGRKALRRFEQLSDPTDFEQLRTQYVQHWMLALNDRDLTAAKAYISKVSSLPTSVKIDSWEKTKGWRFTKAVLSKKIASEHDLESMIMPLKEHFKAD